MQIKLKSIQVVKTIKLIKTKISDQFGSILIRFNFNAKKIDSSQF